MSRPRRRVRGRGAIPPALWPLVVVGVAFLVLPLVGLVVKAPWRAVGDQLTSPPVYEALRLSLICATAATALCVVVGLPLALLLARVEFPGRALVRGVVALPIVLPPVVGGVVLLLAFGRQGLVGRPLDAWFGVGLPFTSAGVVVAETFIALPFFVLAAEGGLRSVDRRLEDAAAVLGAGRFATFWRVTVPLAAPALRAGALLAFARALGEFGATITFAGSLTGTTRTIPLAVYVELERAPAGAIALSVILVVVSLAVIVVLRGRLAPAPARG